MLNVFDLIQKNKCDLLREALANDSGSLDNKNAQGQTPILLASEFGHLDILKILVEHKGCINSQNNHGETPLLVACSKGHFETVKFLISQRAEVLTADDHGLTAVYVAAEKGKVNLLQLLLDNKASVNAASRDGFTPLMVAAYYGQSPAVKLLLACKADPAATSAVGFDSEGYARERSHRAVVELLAAARQEREDKTNPRELMLVKPSLPASPDTNSNRNASPGLVVDGPPPRDPEPNPDNRAPRPHATLEEQTNGKVNEKKELSHPPQNLNSQSVLLPAANPKYIPSALCEDPLALPSRAVRQTPKATGRNSAGPDPNIPNKTKPNPNNSTNPNIQNSPNNPDSPNNSNKAKTTMPEAGRENNT
jgi:ankyrin repeat protein